MTGIVITLEVKPSVELLRAIDSLTKAILTHAVVAAAEAALQPEVPPPVKAGNVVDAPPWTAALIGPEVPDALAAVLNEPSGGRITPHNATTGRPAAHLTDERKALLRRLWPTYATRDEIIERWNALPGEPCTDPDMLSALAQKLKLRRPKDFRQKTYTQQVNAGRFPRAKEPIDATTPILADFHTIKARAGIWGVQFERWEDLGTVNAHALRIGHRPFAPERIGAGR